MQRKERIDPETCQSCGTELGADDDAYDGYCQHCG
jgi:predicted RNA-binding Zn-ribbon protein involved in translation (DUF1610 family)